MVCLIVFAQILADEFSDEPLKTYLTHYSNQNASKSTHEAAYSLPSTEARSLLPLLGLTK
jgi:hypothetical protein